MSILKLFKISLTPLLGSLRSSRGMSIINVTVVIAVMTAVATAMAMMTAENMTMVTNQVLSDRLFYDAIAGIEFTRGQIADGVTDTSFTRRFHGDTISIQITGGKIKVTSSYSGVTRQLQIDSP